MLQFLINNQALILPLLATLLVWVFSRIAKVTIDRTKIIAILNLILDICQDIANGEATKGLSDAEKKALAVANVVAALPPPKKKLVTKIFGTIGGAVEFAWKNRKWLFEASTKLLKAVF